ncbi:MAG: S41 family peptidase [Spirochaetes bacterium]|nr:S41 family peptidase [Spirochaetota bacterium]
MKRMDRRERRIWIISFVTLLIIWFLTSRYFSKIGRANEDLYKNLKVFNEVLSLVEATYVDEPDSQKLIYGAIDGLLASLNDPYSRFMREEGYNDLKIETEGKFGGVGFIITVRDNLLTIIAPIDGTPASKAGLLPGDVIVRIEDEPTQGMDLNVAVSKIRGKPGTTVTLWIIREEMKEPMSYKLAREIINIKSVFSRIIHEEGKQKRIGYAKITKFAEDTPSSLEKACAKFQDEKVDGLILDLRNNPGGLLYTAWKVSDLFLSKGIIVSTKGRIKDQDREYYASSIEYLKNVPIIVLVNEGSASASEIVAGALKDNKRATIVGSKTFGKGVVQTVRELDKTLAIALTTAKYYTPSGECIHNKGIKPNIEVDFPKLKKEDLELINKIWEKEYITTFLKENKKYPKLSQNEQKKLLESLVKKLNSAGLAADYNLVRRLVKSKINETKTMNEAIIDLEDDVQLKKAVEVLYVYNRL